jgi:enoyl-CoA hydratase/carnithine racemase
VIETKKAIPSGTIILKRPEKRNALNREMIQQLSQAFSDFHQEKKVRAVILTASGNSFSSGLDVAQWHESMRADDALDVWHEDASDFQALIEQMLRFPKPIIAAIDGPVMGGGLALLLACDLVVASPEATFSVPATRLGLVSGLVAPLLYFRSGASTAARLMLGCETLSSSQMQTLGLVHYVVPSEQIWARSHQVAQQVEGTAAEAVQLTKRLINEMIGESAMSLLTMGATAMATSCTTEAATEGIQAFVEKRPPKFPGA